MLIGLDATPLLGPRTGIGRYTAELVHRLVDVLEPTDGLRAVAFTVRGRRGLADQVPPGVSVRGLPAPARLLQAVWSRSEWVPVRTLAGRTDVFHGTNFVLPPPGRAAGVVTVHDLAHLRMPGSVASATNVLHELLPRSIARARVICVPSRTVAAELVDQWPHVEQKLVVTPLGVDASWSRTSAPDGAWLASHGLQREYVLFTGNVQPRKGLATVIDALRVLHDRGREDIPVLALAGPAGWGPPLDLDGLPPTAVVRLGHLADADLRSAVAGARAVVYPSLYEGFGLPLLEAFAAGVRVLASDIPTTREVLGASTHLASLFPPGDVGAVAELLGDSDLDPEGAARARRDHAAGHTWDTTARLTHEAYLRALG